MTSITETIADRVSGGKLSEQAAQLGEQSNQLSEQAAQISSLQETNQQYSHDLFTIQESMQRLEQALYSGEWRMLSMFSDQEFTRDGVAKITELARIMKLKNPLIKRGVEIQRLYVWAQGVNISARDENINDVIQSFLDDERNRVEIGNHQARGEREEDLQQDGNLFFRFFINQQNGRIRLRTIDPNEISEIICNPEDKKEPWFYKRTWSQRNLDGEIKEMVEYYPDWRFTPIPSKRLQFETALSVAGRGSRQGDVDWNTPIMHVAVNKVGRWGVCEYYSANDWALSYKNFLEQLATVWQALSRWAMKLNTKGGKRGVAAAKTKLNTTLASGQETNPPPVSGSTFIASEGVDMQPFRTAGATMSAEDGRRLLLMAEMSFGFPETFWGDAKAGSLATAKSLDRPTELKIIDRQALWKSILSDIFSLVTLWAAKAPQGPLRSIGKLEREIEGAQMNERVVWSDNVDGNIDILFPAVIEHDVREVINAIIDAQTLSGRSEGAGIPLKTAVSAILNELGLDNVDEIMTEWEALHDERQERAEQMAAQLGGNDDDDDPDEDPEEDPRDDGDDQAMEAVWVRMETAVSNLVTDLREAMATNGNHA